jgi:hypothetical protein
METRQRSLGEPVETYAVVYRAPVRIDGRTVNRLHQETHAIKAAAEARLAELISAATTTRPIRRCNANAASETSPTGQLTGSL